MEQGCSGHSFLLQRRTAGLLHHVRQFVCGEFQIIGAAMGAIVDVGPVGEGMGAHIPVHLDSVAAGMGAHLAEVHAESRLHEAAHGSRQGIAATLAPVETGFDVLACLEAIGRQCGGTGLNRVGFLRQGLPLGQWRDGGGEGLGLQYLVLIYFRCFIPRYSFRQSGLRYSCPHRISRSGIRHAHHLAGDVIGFLFVSVVCRTDGQFWLETDNLALRREAPCTNQLRHTVVPQCPLELENGGGNPTLERASSQ